MGAMTPVIHPESKARIAVVGAGVFGAWTAEYLRRASHQVTLVDSSGPAHPKASSGGESRMTRAAYGKDEIYSRMAWDSLAEWKMLGDCLGQTIFQPLGVLFFTTTPDDFFAQSLGASRNLGLPIEEMDGKELQARFPMIDFGGVELGLYEPHFGALMARRAVKALVAEFVAQGGEYRQLEARIPQSQGALASIRLSDGSQLEADAFVVATGPWLGKMFPELLGSRIVPTRQEIFYFAPPADETRFSSPHMPG